MDISDIDRTLFNLQQKVNGFGVSKKTEYKPNFKFHFNFKSPLILLGSVPIILLIILCVWRPRLVTVKEDIYREPPIYLLSPKKVLFAVVFISVCIAVTFIGWNKYKNLLLSR
jgi:hypothetical protein